MLPTRLNQPNMNQNPMGNPADFLKQFIQYGRNFQGNAQQTVMNMLNNGQMSQSQFNQLQTMANQFLNTYGNKG